MIYLCLTLHFLGCINTILLYISLEKQGFKIKKGWKFAVIFWPAVPLIGAYSALKDYPNWSEQ